MALAGEIRALRDRVLADLRSEHDYYAETKFAWEFVSKLIMAGNTFTTRNDVTGTVVTQDELAAKAQGYVTGQLAEATFQQFIALFEGFFFDLLRLWLAAYPQSLGGKKIDFKDVLDAPDRDAITRLVVDKELNEVMYERPARWFAYLQDKVKLGCPSADEIERIGEAKAARDVLVHNQGIAGKTYVAKAGGRVRAQEGERIDISEPYHRETWELLCKVAADVSNAAVARVP